MNKQFLPKIYLPLFALTIFASIFLLWTFLDLPRDQELLAIARQYFDTYGLLAVFISSILEGLLLVGWYYPGSIVIFLGVILAGRDLGAVLSVLAVITVGLMISYIINFLLGKYGWYNLLLKFGLKGPLEGAQKKLSKRGLTAIFATYWQPNLASLTATAAGVLHFDIKKFATYSLAAAILWNTFWGTIAYIMGEASLNLIGIRFVLMVFLVWILYSIFFDKPPKDIPQ